MTEQIKLGGSISGYDTLIKEGEVFTALLGEREPDLYLGLGVTLLGDSRGYVPGGFIPDEEATISEFRKPFEQGASDHIILVTTDSNSGWVKPTNIQRDTSHIQIGNFEYRRIRRAVHIAFAEFMDTVYTDMPEAVRQDLPSQTYEFVNAIVSYALQRLPQFAEQLAQTIARLYEESPFGERFIEDPIRTTKITRCTLFLDRDGHIVAVRNPEIVWSTSNPSHLYMKRYESYDVLTGPLSGTRFYPTTRPLGEPVYHAGLVHAAFESGVEHRAEALASAYGPGAAAMDATRDSTDGEDVGQFAQAFPAKRSEQRTRVFISYSHVDARWLKRLQVHLMPLERLGAVSRWDDTMIKPGSAWRDEIGEAIRTAKVAILLVSADFLASKFIVENELPPLLASAEADGARIIPVIVSPCLFNETGPLSRFQAMNPPSHPLASMTKVKQERVFVDIVKAIENCLRG